MEYLLLEYLLLIPKHGTTFELVQLAEGELDIFGTKYPENSVFVQYTIHIGSKLRN